MKTLLTLMHIHNTSDYLSFQIINLHLVVVLAEMCAKEMEEELRKVKDMKAPMAQRRRRMVNLREQREVREMTYYLA